jgi:hypothetical protein
MRKMIPGNHIIRILLVTALILLVPLVAMQLSDEVAWDLTDFIIIGCLLIGTGLIYELIAKKVSSVKYRAAIALALLAALLLVWAELAVGVFGTPFSGS